MVSLSVEDVAMDPVSVDSSRHHMLNILYGISMIRCILCSFC
jgi:formate hydrogenlyase subunit 6/NADH:ubiquinone oxidoreductase subunit I